MLDRLRKKIETSDRLARLLGRCLALWIRVCHRTTRWEAAGLDELASELAQGPVIVILWHESLLMGPAHWPRASGPLTGIRDPSPVARIAGAVQREFGLEAAAMSRRTSNQAAVRQVLRAAADGMSIAITGDGPAGPRRELKSAPLDWARAAGLPVYIFAWDARWRLRLGSWDAMLFPLPFTAGAFRFERWSDPLPRRSTFQEAEAVRGDVSRALRAAGEDCARRAGRL